jgi:hypothetical protein
MCTVPQDIMDKMEATVKDFLDQGRMFTGYDVTIETRTREKMMLRHQDVRGAVHEMVSLNDAMDFGHQMLNGTVAKWRKTQKDMPGGGWAFVYHPDNVDPNGYQPRNQNVISSHNRSATYSPASVAVCPAPTLSISAANDGATTDSGGANDDGTFATDYRERLMIPTRFMKDAGIKAGDFSASSWPTPRTAWCWSARTIRRSSATTSPRRKWKRTANCGCPARR